MQVKPVSVTGTARRLQIIAGTVAVIAEQGYDRASFARIAERAGISSTRLISYHFAGKSELMAAVAAEVITSIGVWTGRRVAAEESAAGQLRAYIEATVAFIDQHRDQMAALTGILLAGALEYSADDDGAAGAPLEDILRRGQAAGEFRPFDPLVMSAAVQRCVDGLPFLLQREPELDCRRYAAELVTLFELGTSAGPGPPRCSAGEQAGEPAADRASGSSAGRETGAAVDGAR
ncbi:TetR/AcrR family transcriptional regulator [Arthrobacter sp. ATA002]|uniref:TetR/AcrR family transcriptional regulator n=1 Tax=Arthrobacter sp. ATA002 TaxID=2991715 RepID=UPI0022A6FA85|nr:TetR/AcrR family transcriptional regulator [Arthrobacter sp. ATA002]WAP51652.1 TetR/AcrR family transcriptional regulator [Arthrobacter sp. ATA002]